MKPWNAVTKLVESLEILVFSCLQQGLYCSCSLENFVGSCYHYLFIQHLSSHEDLIFAVKSCQDKTFQLVVVVIWCEWDWGAKRWDKLFRKSLNSICKFFAPRTVVWCFTLHTETFNSTEKKWSVEMVFFVSIRNCGALEIVSDFNIKEKLHFFHRSST